MLAKTSVVLSLIWSKVKSSYRRASGQQGKKKNQGQNSAIQYGKKINKRITKSYQLLVIYNLVPSELTYKKYL